MKMLYSKIMLLAMMVAVLGLTACGDDEEDEIDDNNSIVGLWEVVSIDFNGADGVESELRVGDRLYINANGTFNDTEDSGRWTLNGKVLTFYTDGEYQVPAVFEISRLTSNELVLKIDYGLFNATIKYKRVS